MPERTRPHGPKAQDADYLDDIDSSAFLQLATASSVVSVSGSTYYARKYDGSLITSGTDARTVLQAACDLGGLVFVRAGTYSLTGTTLTLSNAETTLIGEGMETVFSLASSQTINMVTVTGTRVRIRDIKFDGNYASQTLQTRAFTDCVTTSGSTTITSATAAFTSTDEESPISGTGIPTGTVIRSVTNSTTAVLSKEATASATVTATLTDIRKQCGIYADSYSGADLLVQNCEFREFATAAINYSRSSGTMSGFVVQCCSFFSNSTTSGAAIHLGYLAEYTRIRDCAFDTGFVGIRCSDAANTSIRGCVIGYMRGVGIDVTRSSHGNYGKISITNCQLNHTVAGIPIWIEGLSGNPCVIFGNQFIANEAGAIYVKDSTQTQIVGNYFDDNSSLSGSADTYWDIKLEGTTTRTVVQSNYCPSTSNSKGLLFEADTSATNNHVTDNIVETAPDTITLCSSSTTYARRNIGHSNVASKTSAYTVLNADEIVLADATGGAFAVTLPAASARRDQIVIKKTDSSANAVTVTRAGSDTIDGATTYALSTQYQSVTLVSDGTSTWYVV